MTTVVVTGASGFIGRHVVSLLSERGMTVRGTTRSGRHHGLAQVDYHDARALAGVLDGADTVIHVAGVAHLTSRSVADPARAFHDGNVDIAVNVAKASKDTDVRRFILLSSAGVLGLRSPPGGLRDTSPAMPYDAYTESKFEAEQRVSDTLAHQCALTIVRPPMVYGPGAPGSYRRLCNWIERGLPLPIGRLNSRRSFIGIRNLCDLLLTITNAIGGGAGEPTTLLAADHEPISVATFAQAIAAVRQRRALLVPVPDWLLRPALQCAGFQDEYRRLALPFELTPSRTQTLYGWSPPLSTTEELTWAFAQDSRA